MTISTPRPSWTVCAAPLRVPLCSLQVSSSITSSPLISHSTTAGTTRDNFAGKPVKELQYTAYRPRALRSMLTIARDVRDRHGLRGVAMIHRLGTVPIGEESILIAVSAPHRQAAWRAGEEALEECKAKVEVWKREEFEGEEGVWRANRDGVMGQREEKS
ncbi:hypothetical protein NW757_007999 [Fusarium falciforme]|nr:hypothetical protein NW757_007999 [Fusarium falciforme]